MIRVHHLNFSRSTRVIWLLEELGLPYDLITYQREASFRAPDTLKAVHPLGKAPVIEDGALRLAESGTVLDYINTRYGGGALAPAAGTDDAWRHNEWVHYAESSAGLPIMLTLLGSMMGGLPTGLSAFTESELTKALTYIQEQISDGPYLMGAQFTIADIQLSYLLAAVRRIGALTGYPGLPPYLERLEGRPAFVRAVEVGGPMVPG